ncbi:unnamed protein product [Gongylonema pulchrum]|uniref:Pepsin-I3 domain-containing protein n=1 Tax=Gongylonema pulchrum TaxID=637853 RepID=A0A183D0J7_9BILA|nr:unnamed protein product [Gongylonema pulchrum]
MEISATLGEFINSFNGNFMGSGVVCVNNVCYSGSGGPFLFAGMGCSVINNKIYKDGVYLRDMNAADYEKLRMYEQAVQYWTQDLQDSIQRSFPWDPRNPQHVNFPWNMMSRVRRHAKREKMQRRSKRFLPFPAVPYFC